MSFIFVNFLYFIIMNNILFTNQNINNLTKDLITILKIPVSNDENFKKYVLECKNLIYNTLIEVYNKYAPILEPSNENIIKINKKCLSNSILKIKNHSQKIINTQKFQNPNNIQQNTFTPPNNIQQNNFTSPNNTQQNYFNNPNHTSQSNFQNPNNIQQNNQNNPQNLTPFSGSNNFAPLIPLSQLNGGGIINAMGGFGSLTPSNNYNNNISKKEFSNELNERKAQMEMERKTMFNDNTPQHNLQQSPGFNVEDWLGLNRNTQQNNIQNNNNFQNNDSYQNTQSQDPQMKPFDSYSPSTAGGGSSFNEAYSGRKLSDTQNKMIEEQDPNKRLEMLKNSRSEIDDFAKQYQTGKSFDPTKSPYESNKQIDNIFF
jgi:hypothetical protein